MDQDVPSFALEIRGLAKSFDKPAVDGLDGFIYMNQERTMAIRCSSSPPTGKRGVGRPAQQVLARPTAREGNETYRQHRLCEVVEGLSFALGDRLRIRACAVHRDSRERAAAHARGGGNAGRLAGR